MVSSVEFVNFNNVPSVMVKLGIAASNAIGDGHQNHFDRGHGAERRLAVVGHDDADGMDVPPWARPGPRFGYMDSPASPAGAAGS